MMIYKHFIIYVGIKKVDIKVNLDMYSNHFILILKRFI